MSKDIKQMILINVIFVTLYMLSNWFEYSSLNFHSDSNTAIGSSFPFYIETTTYHPMTGAIIVGFIPNFSLWIFLFAILANTYFIFRFQRSKETKQTT